MKLLQLILVTLFLTWSPPSIAVSPIKRAKLQTIMNVINNSEALFAAKIFAMKSIWQDKRLTDSQKPQILKNISRYITKDSLRNVEMDVWDKNFTDREVDQMVQFWQSPAGKKLVSMSPLVKAKAKGFAQQTLEQVTHLKY